MKMKIEVKLPYPVSANIYWRMRVNPRTRKPYMSVSAKGRQYKKLVGQILALKKLNRPTKKPLFVDITLHPKMNLDGTESKVLIDLDNALKVTLDSLEGYIYAKDKQIRKIIAEIGKPRVDGEISLVIHHL